MVKRLKKKREESIFYVKHEQIYENMAKEEADIYYIQQWFVRASWRKKAQFIKNLIRTIEEETALKSLVKALSPITKDIFYVQTQATKFSCDVVPNDDDRALDSEILKNVIEMDCNWIKSLKENTKINIIISLVKMGGTELAKLAVTEANQLANIYEFITFLESKFVKRGEQEDTQILNHTQGLSELFKDVYSIFIEITKNKDVVPLINEHKMCLALRPKLQNIPGLSSALKKINSKRKAWKSQLAHVLQTIRGGKGKVRVQAHEPDSFQLLPLWVTRQIAHLSDEDTRKELANVDRYWKFTVDEVAREEEVRANLNKIIQNMETKLANVKLPGIRFSAQIKKLKKTGEKKKREVYKLNSAQISLLFDTKEKDLKQSIYTLVKMIPLKEIPFRGLYRDMIISTPYMYDRSIDCTRRWIASSDNTEVVLYNLITGVKSSYVLTGHTLVVTCLAFFPVSFRVVTGSLDTSVRTWDLWSKSQIEIFKGHTDVIISVAVNEEYTASCSRDRTLRIFKQKSGGNCVKLINFKLRIPVMVVISMKNTVYWCSLKGTIHMFTLTEPIIERNIEYAHKGEITFIGKFGRLIVTRGSDNFVRIWNENMKSQSCLIHFFHNTRVNSLAISHLTLITACEDGALRFWFINSGQLYRTIQINISQIEIISICCQNYYNHVKLICNNESNIVILEFPFKSEKKIGRGNNPFQGILLHPLNRLRTQTSGKKRLIKLHFNKCTLPVIRSRENYKNLIMTTDSLLKRTITDSREIESFPRYYLEEE